MFDLIKKYFRFGKKNEEVEAHEGDPTHDHDPEALDDAAKKMHTDED